MWRTAFSYRGPGGHRRPDDLPPGHHPDVRVPESGLAETLRDAEQRVPGFASLEITTCLRRGEIEMVTRYEPDAADGYSQLVELLRERHGQHIFSEDGSKVDDQVAELLTGRRIATAESCTGGCSRHG